MAVLKYLKAIEYALVVFTKLNITFLLTNK
jgi:hypothetical protein